MAKKKKSQAADANDLATLRYQAMQQAVNAGKQISAAAPTAPAPAAKPAPCLLYTSDAADE